MAIKQGEEDTQIVKEENDPRQNYIFQENEKTKMGAAIITVVLVIILVGLMLSGVIFEN